MQPNRLIYGAWGLLLVGAAVIAVANSQSESEIKTGDPSQLNAEVTPEPGGQSASSGLAVTPAGFAQDEAPRRLPVVSDSDPLAAAKLKELRRIVSEEMPGASDVQLDVWTEEFADMPEEAVRMMLQQRRELKGLPPAKTSVSVPVTEPVRVQVAATSIDRAVSFEARAIVLRNLANANTVGYCRRVVEFAGSSATSLLNIAELRFDMSSPLPVHTGRSMDFSVTSGFFVVEDGDRSLFTRAGRFSVGEDQHLVLRVDGRQLKLAGLKPLPKRHRAASRLRSRRCERNCRRGVETKLGQIRVARFLDASRMASDDGCLFSATSASGSPIDVAAPQVRQGELTQSNVDVRAERQMLELLNQ